jgi:hypothetical protein
MIITALASRIASRIARLCTPTFFDRPFGLKSILQFAHRIVLCVVLCAILLGVSTVLTSCRTPADNGLGTNPSTLKPVLISTVAEGRTRWQAHKLSAYTLEQRYTCFCPLANYTVRFSGGKLVELLKADGAMRPLPIYSYDSTRVLSVDALFQRVESLQADFAAKKVERFVVTFDSLYGYPRDFFVDVSSRIADEEYGIITTLKP